MGYISMALAYSMVGYMLLDRILGPNLNNTQGIGFIQHSLAALDFLSASSGSRGQLDRMFTG